MAFAEKMASVNGFLHFFALVAVIGWTLKWKESEKKVEGKKIEKLY